MNKETLSPYPSVLFFILVLIVFFLADHFGFEELIHSDSRFSFVFFGASAFLFHLLVNRGLENKREQFIQFYLASVAVRIVLALIFLVVFMILKVENLRLFVLNFLVLYLCFTLFEIINLYRNLRRFL